MDGSRTILCMIAVTFRHDVDGVDLFVWAVSALAIVAGAWQASREKPAEDLTHTIFPDDE